MKSVLLPQIARGLPSVHPDLPLCLPTLTQTLRPGPMRLHAVSLQVGAPDKGGLEPWERKWIIFPRALRENMVLLMPCLVTSSFRSDQREYSALSESLVCATSFVLRKQ